MRGWIRYKKDNAITSTPLIPGPGYEPPRFLEAKLMLARGVLILQRLWPLLWPGIGIIGVFVATSLFSFWDLVPSWLHALGLIFTLCAALYTAWRLAKSLRWPSRAQALHWIEESSGIKNRALSALEDEVANRYDHPGFVLWEAHKHRLIANLGRLIVKAPDLSLVLRDPRALRVPVFILIFAGFIAAGSDSPQRILSSVQLDLGGNSATPSIDVWLTPPEYTDLGPIVLNSTKEGDEVTVVEGSRIHTELEGGWRTPNAFIGDETYEFIDHGKQRYSLDLTLNTAKGLRIHQGTRVLGNWPLVIAQDQPPIAVFPDLPEQTLNHALRIAFEVYDDFGIASLHIETKGQKRLGKWGETIEISPPKTQRKGGVRAFHYEDLSASPWAGEDIEMKLVAKDALGQDGHSLPIRVTLPERDFKHPVARALIDVRKNLFKRPEARGAPSRFLDAIARSPQEYDGDLTAYAAMRLAHWRLIHDQEFAAIEQVTDILWDTALRLEDGGLSQAQQKLRETMQDLMSALQENSEADVSDLLDKLRQRMAEMLQNQLERMQQDTAQNQPQAGTTQSIDSSQLERMMQQIEDMAAAGDLEGAMEMLAALQSMMENLQVAQGGMSEADMERLESAQQAMQDLEELTEAQRQLMNETVRQSLSGPNQNGEGTNRNPGSPSRPGGESPMDELAGMQQRLGQALEDIQQQLGDAGLPAPGPLDGAGQAMDNAADNLTQGQDIPALRDQGQALDQLRQARDQLGEALNEAMQRMQAQGAMTDPLGRPNNQSFSNQDVTIPSEADFQRAREIRKELERRLSDPSRPLSERNYIKRLLERF